MITEIGRVKFWISTERLGQKEVLDRDTGMVFSATTTTNCCVPSAVAVAWPDTISAREKI